MTNTDDRIAQFEHMATADPDNEMAHFSLGNAYLQAERAAEAAVSFERCIELNPDMSKAYELAGQSLIKAGWSDRAVEVLNTGYVKAVERGDQLPRQAMAELLEGLGREAPTISAEVEAAAEERASSGTFTCSRTGRDGNQLEDPPFRGPIGEWIHTNIAAETWREWIDQGTKVINELRLDLSRDEDSATYDKHMHEFLGVPEELSGD
jgi:Fe-S cluster biosynthesis and repair protein YggX